MNTTLLKDMLKEIRTKADKDIFIERVGKKFFVYWNSPWGEHSEECDDIFEARIAVSNFEQAKFDLCSE